MTVEDATANANFTVDIDGVAVGGFFVVAFPTSRIEVVAFREGNSLRTRYLPGRLVHDRLVLRRAAVPNSELHAWWQQTVSGNVQRRAISVGLLDASRQEVQRVERLRSLAGVL